MDATTIEEICSTMNSNYCADELDDSQIERFVLENMCITARSLTGRERLFVDPARMTECLESQRNAHRVEPFMAWLSSRDYL